MPLGKARRRVRLSLKGRELDLCVGGGEQVQWGADIPRVGDSEDSWVLGNRTLVLHSIIFIAVTIFTTLTHSHRFWGINKMAKGTWSASQLAQSQFKMGHQFAVAEREEARRKESENLWILLGLWLLTTKILGI